MQVLLWIPSRFCWIEDIVDNMYMAIGDNCIQYELITLVSSVDLLTQVHERSVDLGSGRLINKTCITINLPLLGNEIASIEVGMCMFIIY